MINFIKSVRQEPNCHMNTGTFVHSIACSIISTWKTGTRIDHILTMLAFKTDITYASMNTVSEGQQSIQ